MIILIAVAITAVCLALSWAVTCGIVYLITLCFGLPFSWPVATGIWLILILLRNFFGSDTKRN